LFADHTHTTTTASKGGLDDDGKAVLVGEFLDILKLLHGTVGTGYDGNLGLHGDITG